MMQRVLAAVALPAAVLLAGGAFAQFAKTEDAVKYRQSVMSVVGTHFARMGAAVKGEAPYAPEAFEKDAALVATLMTLPWEAFMAPGSDKGSGMKPEALAKRDDFMRRAAANQAEIAKLLAAARAGGGLAAVRAPFGAAGASCKACHDDFRRK
jgi:cytochrome c556